MTGHFDVGPATCGTNVGPTGTKNKIMVINLKKPLLF